MFLIKSRWSNLIMIKLKEPKKVYKPEIVFVAEGEPIQAPVIKDPCAW